MSGSEKKPAIISCVSALALRTGQIRNFFFMRRLQSPKVYKVSPQNRRGHALSGYRC